VTAGPLAELHDDLRAVARDLLGAVDPEAGPTWRAMADAGWLGLEVPEALGGAGATFAEVAVVAEELGRAIAPGPYLGAAVLGVGALLLAEPGPVADALLRDLADGSSVAVLALGAEDGGVGSELPFRVERAAAGARLHGQAACVLDATEADRLLLPAVEVDGSVVLVPLAPSTPGLRVTPQPVLDATRRLGVVSVEGDRVDLAGVEPLRLRGDAAACAPALREQAAVAVACDSLGIAGAMLDATVAYVAVREQFGRPVGSFQAVKHACADMLVQVTVARGLVRTAADAVAARAPDAGSAVSRAKAYAGDAAVAVAGSAMQLHGGIGYTWESGIHAHLKRAMLDRALFGTPAVHRRRLVERHR
jgi:alkylation response protein AidB-like acyl-CoA dehydrogenase